MSSWTHNICWDCWREQEGQGAKEPPRSLEDGIHDVCCWCGKSNHSGIYLRADPDEMPCMGIHKEEL